MDYEGNGYYILERGYELFKEVYRIDVRECLFVVRGKRKLKYKRVKWKGRMGKKIMRDGEVKVRGYVWEKKYGE